MINFIDLIILGILVYFIWSGYQSGLVLGILNLVRTLTAFFLSVLYYPTIGNFLVDRFHLAQPVGQILGFVIILLVVEIILGFAINLVHKTIFQFLFKFKPLYLADKFLGIIPSLIIGALLITTFTLLPLILPLGARFKEPIEKSWWGRNVIPQAIGFEPALESLVKRLPTRNLIYIVTREPQSEETIPIQIPKYTALKVSEKDEELMLKLLNQERTSRGLQEVKFDEKLREVARAHSKDMFERGYFSHFNPDKESPFDRMDKMGVQYLTAGENLAYAPTTEIAHRGLMNSPGHKANILKDSFGKVGIGVIDGGLYGKMFSQEFTD